MPLQTVWFVLLGLLLVGYAVLDGFDLGVGALHLFTRTDHDRRVLLNAIGPVWDGNEVWLVVFGGALFAAFPRAYATALSALYLPVMALLAGLIFRAVAIEFRSKSESRAWRAAWDVAFAAASVALAFLFGVAIGAVMRGLPLDAEGNFRGTPGDLVSPFGALVGALCVALFALHGGVYLLTKTEDALHARVRRWVWTASGVFFVLYFLTTLAAVITVPHATAGFARRPWAWALVVTNVLAAANVPRAVYRARHYEAFVSSALTIACLVGLFGLAQYPYLVRSTLGPATSLTLTNAASSPYTLTIMLIVAAIGMPFVLTYTAVVHWVFRGRVKVGKHSY